MVGTVWIWRGETRLVIRRNWPPGDACCHGAIRLKQWLPPRCVALGGIFGASFFASAPAGRVEVTTGGNIPPTPHLKTKRDPTSQKRQPSMESINATFSTWPESYGSGPGARHPYTMPALQCVDLRVARYVGRGPLSKVAFIYSLFLCPPSALDALKCKRGVGEPRCSCSNDAHLHMETSSTHSAGVAFIYSMGGLRGCDGKVCVLHVAGNSLQECRTFKGCRPPFSALHPMGPSIFGHPCWDVPPLPGGCALHARVAGNSLVPHFQGLQATLLCSPPHGQDAAVVGPRGGAANLLAACFCRLRPQHARRRAPVGDHLGVQINPPSDAPDIAKRGAAQSPTQ